MPDINIVCYLSAHPALTTLAEINALQRADLRADEPRRRDDGPEYIITRTRLRSPMYDGAVDPLLAALGVCTADEWKASGDEGLVVLRSTVMDPFLVADPPAPDHLGGFVRALQRVASASI